MTFSVLLVCAEETAISVFRLVLEELGMKVELCADPVRASVRLAQERYNLIVLDCKTKREAIGVLMGSRSSRVNDATLAVVVVDGQESVREMFALGVNFVVYKPVAYERALSSLQAAQNVLYKDKRRKTRATVHAQATVEYASGEQVWATLIDLAEDGMAVTFGTKLPPTSKVYFQFQLPGQKSTVRLSGQVVWQESNGRAGVQFVNVPQTSRRVLSEWLQRNLEETRKGEAARPVYVEQTSTAVLGAGGQLVRPAAKAAEERNSQDQDAVARLRSQSGNRRGQTRYACRLGAEVFRAGSSVRNYCYLSDLSPGGCYLEITLVFPAGSAVEITVRTHEMKLRVSGEVKMSNPGRGMGILFKMNTQEERQGVQQLIDFVATATLAGE
jgi:CheY-like chemotaxis protein